MHIQSVPPAPVAPPPAAFDMAQAERSAFILAAPAPSRTVTVRRRFDWTAVAAAALVYAIAFFAWVMLAR